MYNFVYGYKFADSYERCLESDLHLVIKKKTDTELLLLYLS